MFLKEVPDFEVGEGREIVTRNGGWQQLSLQDGRSKTDFGNRMRSVADSLENYLGARTGRV